MYEAYGPAGIALLIECLTDNRNRSASDVRVAVTRNGGTMADAGSTARMFSRKGVVTVAKEQDGRDLTEDDVLEATLDADPEEVNDLGDSFEIISDPGRPRPGPDRGPGTPDWTTTPPRWPSFPSTPRRSTRRPPRS